MRNSVWIPGTHPKPNVIAGIYSSSVTTQRWQEETEHLGKPEVRGPGAHRSKPQETLWWKVMTNTCGCPLTSTHHGMCTPTLIHEHTHVIHIHTVQVEYSKYIMMAVFGRWHLWSLLLLARLKQETHKFKACLDHIAGSRTTWGSQQDSAPM